MIHANTVLVRLMMFVLVSVTFFASSGTVATPTAPQASFARVTRVVLKGEAAAELINYCGQAEGIQPSARRISDMELDDLEAKLLPLLRDDLLSAGSKHRAQNYYRQYATAVWKEHRMIYVLGFHELSSPVLADDNRWKSRPAIVSDGGAAFWCAIYVQDTQQFAGMKEEGGPVRTVRFNGNG